MYTGYTHWRIRNRGREESMCAYKCMRVRERKTERVRQTEERERDGETKRQERETRDHYTQVYN